MEQAVQAVETQDVQPEVTETLLPERDFNPVNPAPGAKYIPDEEYDSIQGKGSPAQQDQASDNDGGEGAGTAAAADPAKPADNQQPTFDVSTWIKEKTGGQFEKEDDLLEFVKNPVKFENDAAKQVYEYLQQGKLEDVSNFLMQQQILSGVDKMDSETVIKLQMKINDPDATDDDIEMDFEDKYRRPDVDGMSDDDAKKALRRFNRSLERDAADAKASLQKLKQELKLPELPKAKEAVIKPEDIEKEIQQLDSTISESVNKALSSLEKLSFTVEDKSQGVAIPIAFDISPENKAEVKQSLSNFFNDFETRYGQGDQFDGEKLAKERLIINNFDKILKSAVLTAYNKGKLDTKLGAAQADLTVVSPKGESVLPDQEVENVRRVIRGGR